jgi:hypothetical protein
MRLEDHPTVRKLREAGWGDATSRGKDRSPQRSYGSWRAPAAPTTSELSMVKLKSGGVRMAVEDALSRDEKEEGYILACQAEPKGDVELEA